MKLTLTKDGGQAAGMRRPRQVLDADALPKPAAGELARLVAAAKAVPTAVQKESKQARDAMTLTITVDDDGGTTVLSQSDMNMCPAFAALFTCLERHLAAAER